MSLRRIWDGWLRVREVLGRCALPLGLVGLAAVALYNWQQWQRDKELLAETKQPPPLPPLDEWTQLPLVSVLVAAWNEADFIERHIESFLSLRYPNKELVLCAGGYDGTYHLARGYEGPTVTALEQRAGEGKQRALARTLPKTSGGIIFLTDADCLLDDDAFERTVRSVAEGEEQVATGTSCPLMGQLTDPFIWNQWAPQRYRELMAASHYADGIMGRNCAVARPALQEAWSEDDEVPIGTDYYLALRLQKNGHRIRCVTGSAMQTHYPESLGAYVQQQTRWLRNLFMWGYWFRDWAHVRHALLTAMLGAFMLLAPLMAPLGCAALLVAWFLMLASAFLSRLRYLGVVVASERTQVELSPSLLTVIVGDLIAWSRLWIDVWHRRWRARW